MMSPFLTACGWEPTVISEQWPTKHVTILKTKTKFLKNKYHGSMLGLSYSPDPSFLLSARHHSPHLSLEGLYKIYTYMLWRRWEVLFGPRIPSRLQYCSYRRSLTTLIVLVLPPSLPYPSSRKTFINPTTPSRKRQAAVRASPLRKASRLKTSLAQLNSTIPTPQEAITYVLYNRRAW